MITPKGPRQEVGQAIRAKTLQYLADIAEKASRLTGGVPFSVWASSGGALIRDSRARPFYARLSGSSSPYTFYEAYPLPGGRWADLIGGRTGQVYEINGTTGMDGEHHRIKLTTAGDYRFKAVSVGCNPSTSRICTKILICGNSYTQATGVTVTAQDTDGNTLGPCTASGMLDTITRVSGGAGYTNGVGYSLGITGTGTGAAGTFDVIGGVVTNIQIISRGQNYTSITISFPGAGAGSGARATATLALGCCIPITKKGTYTLTVDGACPGPKSQDVVANCGENYTTIALDGGTVTFSNFPNACGLYATGFITLTGPWGFTSTARNFGSGGMSPAPPNTLTWCVPADGTYTATFSTIGCNDPVSPKSVNVSGCTGTFSLTQSGATSSYTFNVQACNGPAVGAVGICTSPSGGTFHGTADAGGDMTFSGLMPGCHYDISITYDGCAGYDAAEFGLDAGCSQNQFAGTVDMPVDPAYICCSGGPPTKKALNGSGPAGPVPMTYGGSCAWFGCVTVTQPAITDNPFLPTACGGDTLDLSSIEVAVALSFVSATEMFMSVTYRCCTAPDGVTTLVAKTICLGGGVVGPTSAKGPCTDYSDDTPVSQCPLMAILTISGSRVANLNGVWTFTDS